MKCLEEIKIILKQADMYSTFLKYRILIIKALILISLFGVALTSGALKSALLGAGTALAIISFGESFVELKKHKIVGDVSRLNNE